MLENLTEPARRSTLPGGALSDDLLRNHEAGEQPLVAGVAGDEAVVSVREAVLRP